MSHEPSGDTVVLQGWLDRLAAGEKSARAELIKLAEVRLTRLTRKMLRSFPLVHRWELTDDVFQNSVMRIHTALGEVTPVTVSEFMKFSAFLIRRELIDLSRHYGGAEGVGRKHQSISDLDVAVKSKNDRANVEEQARWTDFHEAVGNLPEELRTVFDLIWYQEQPQSSVATLLGVSARTVQRRWLEARIKLHSLLKAEPPMANGEP
jgi:RNA polymerase sigma-70 factor (ECF subfamily)